MVSFTTIQVYFFIIGILAGGVLLIYFLSLFHKKPVGPAENALRHFIDPIAKEARKAGSDFAVSYDWFFVEITLVIHRKGDHPSIVARKFLLEKLRDGHEQIVEVNVGGDKNVLRNLTTKEFQEQIYMLLLHENRPLLK